MYRLSDGMADMRPSKGRVLTGVWVRVPPQPLVIGPPLFPVLHLATKCPVQDRREHGVKFHLDTFLLVTQGAYDVLEATHFLDNLPLYLKGR